MLIAVEGCSHGELDKIYETLDHIATEHGKKVDLLLCCGDFQAVRNVFDLSCMAVPPKYLSMQTFHKYYSGEKVAPVLTILIGGNHEASNHLQELSYSGWVAPNIFYLGNAGVVEFGGLRIAGLSGIYKGHDYLRGHFECPSYSENTKRSVYHVRQLEVFRLKQITRPIDIFLSHDWPAGIEAHGDSHNLLRIKPFLRSDIEKGELGNPPAWDVLKKLRPKYWFSAHLHCKFTAVVKHGENEGETKFLALDKCNPHRKFLQVLDIPTEFTGEPTLSLDPEWLGILKSTDHLWSFLPAIHHLPGPGSSERFDFTQTDENLEEIRTKFGDSLKVDPGSFQRTAPSHEGILGDGAYEPIVRKMNEMKLPWPPRKSYINPQTTWLCEKLGVRDPLVELLKIAEEKNAKLEEEEEVRRGKTTMEVVNAAEIQLNGDGNENGDGNGNTGDTNGEAADETNGETAKAGEIGGDLYQIFDTLKTTQEDGDLGPVAKKARTEESAPTEGAGVEE